MTKAFISYHHTNDQFYKEHLVQLAEVYGAFEDCSVDTGEIDENLPSETIRRIIRDNYLRDSEVTILLCGAETKYRKHIDWELKSSMIDGQVNRKSGILVIDLPSSGHNSWHTSLLNEKEIIYPDYSGGWRTIDTKSEYQQTYPNMPERIIDNLLKTEVKLSIVPWSRIESNPQNLSWLIDATAKASRNNEYDLTLKMRRNNHNPNIGFSRVAFN